MSATRHFAGIALIAAAAVAGALAQTSSPAPQLSAEKAVVAPPTGASRALFRNLDGNWFDPNEPGWGVNIVQGDSGALFAVWLTYHPPSSISNSPHQPPMWLVMSAGQWLSPTTFRGLLHETHGTGFNHEFDPTRLRLDTVGAVTLSFANDREASFEAEFIFEGAVVPKRAALRRFEF